MYILRNAVTREVIGFDRDFAKVKRTAEAQKEHAALLGQTIDYEVCGLILLYSTENAEKVEEAEIIPAVPLLEG